MPCARALGIPAISGLRVYLGLRLVRGWGRLRKSSHPSLTGPAFPFIPRDKCSRGLQPGALILGRHGTPARITNAFPTPRPPFWQKSSGDRLQAGKTETVRTVWPDAGGRQPARLREQGL